MVLINKDFSSVPDELPVLKAGKYLLKVIAVDADTKTKKNNQEMITLGLVVDDEDSEFNGIQIKDWIVWQTPLGEVKLKRYLLSAGRDPSEQFDPDEFVDDRVMALVTTRQVTVEGTDETETRSNVRTYVIPKGAAEEEGED
jgi:hypothetical protein